MNPEIVSLLKLAGTKFEGWAESHKAEFLAQANAANHTAATALSELAKRVFEKNPVLAPYSGLLVTGMQAVMPELIAAAGGEEEVLFKALMALIQDEVGKL